MEKLYNERGEVAVIVSPGYGAGWSSWADSEVQDKILFDKDIASAILNEDYKLAAKIADEKYPGVYCGGLKKCRVEWIKKGTAFRIDEYDGSERLIALHSDHYVA